MLPKSPNGGAEISNKNTKLENKTEKIRATPLYIRKKGRKITFFENKYGKIKASPLYVRVGQIVR